MLIREYRESDLDALKRIHARQNFPYQFPDLGNPLFLTKIVSAGRKSGNSLASSIRAAALLRLTAEAYLLLDPDSGGPREKWQCLLALHDAAQRDARQRGLEDVHAWLPPAIAKQFGRRLNRLGWIRDDTWTPYCRKLNEES